MKKMNMVYFKMQDIFDDIASAAKKEGVTVNKYLEDHLVPRGWVRNTLVHTKEKILCLGYCSVSDIDDNTLMYGIMQYLSFVRTAQALGFDAEKYIVSKETAVSYFESLKKEPPLTIVPINKDAGFESIVKELREVKKAIASLAEVVEKIGKLAAENTSHISDIKDILK